MRFNEFNLTASVETDNIKQLQTDLKAAGANLGRSGPNNDGVDGKIGSLTQTAMLKFPEIAAKYKKDLKAALARGSFALTDPRRIKFGKNPNIDKTTRDKALDYVTKLDKKDSDDILPVDGRVSSPFGYRTLGGHSKNHNGTDFAVSIGTPIVAPADGVISRAGNKDGPEGKFIVLDASGVVHKFFHLSKIMVAPGESVDQGQTIGLSGNTGRSTGAHLHWEKHVAGLPVDPMLDMG